MRIEQCALGVFIKHLGKLLTAETYTCPVEFVLAMGNWLIWVSDWLIILKNTPVESRGEKNNDVF
jgi:hypothetical protein